MSGIVVTALPTLIEAHYFEIFVDKKLRCIQNRHPSAFEASNHGISRFPLPFFLQRLEEWLPRAFSHSFSACIFWKVGDCIYEHYAFCQLRQLIDDETGKFGTLTNHGLPTTRHHYHVRRRFLDNTQRIFPLLPIGINSIRKRPTSCITQNDKAAIGFNTCISKSGSVHRTSAVAEEHNRPFRSAGICDNAPSGYVARRSIQVVVLPNLNAGKHAEDNCAS